MNLLYTLTITMLNFVLRYMKWLNLENFKWRKLTLGEIQICQSVFANLIDYDQVIVMNHPYLPWQPVGMCMAPDGWIYLKDPDYCDDFSTQPLIDQALFIHEMAHIYQHQQKINVLFKGAILQSALYLSLGKFNPYKYQLKTDKPYSAYNIEQQGDIARDIFLKRIDNIILSTKTSNSSVV